jgi:prepilin signal peptidase PulO-like enzyme (type II secretory pathway)
MVLEVCCGLLAAGLYGWEVVELGLAFHLNQGMNAGPRMPPITSVATVHAQFAVHLILAMFMVAISFIDIDEQTIPDELAVPGTLLGLMLLAVLPMSRLPDVPFVFINPQNIMIQGPPERWMNAASPWNAPAALSPSPNVASLALGVGCFWLWCVGLLPRPWRTRHGWLRATQLMWARIARERVSRIILGIAIAGGIGIAAVWWIGGAAWESLVCVLLGLAFGGLLIWLIRVIGGAALGKEVMGFGDVTLMAMIGTYLGWQATFATFVHAVFIALILGVIQWAARRDNVIPFGPFLCGGALLTIVRWRTLWYGSYDYFATGWPIPAIIVACLILLGIMLWLLRIVRGY